MKYIQLTFMALLSLTVLLSTVLSSTVLAVGSNFPDNYFTKENPNLTPQERASIAIAKKWQSSSNTGIKPVAGPDGSIRFLFGSQQPSIVCAVLQVCDIQLQPGEQVNSIHLGDQVRWQVEPAITGGSGHEIQHLIVKPLDVGLETSLVVTTNRRTYHMRLRSHRREFMPRVAFIYPEDVQAKWDAVRTRENHAMDIRQTGTIPATGEYLGDLDFLYKVTGSASWKPLRVYNDGIKTIIQMPTSFAQEEAPILMVLRENSGLFSKAETTMVNYRLQEDRYVVDTVFDKAVLIVGVGGKQDRITITRSN